MSSYLNYTDPSGNEVEVLESLKGWIIDPDTQAQKTIENYENQRLNIEDAIESGLLNNRAGQIFLDYGDIVMGPVFDQEGAIMAKQLSTIFRNE